MSKVYNLTLSDHLAEKVEEVAASRDEKPQEFIRTMLRTYFIIKEHKQTKKK